MVLDFSMEKNFKCLSKKRHTTWGFMQVGLDKLSFRKLQNQALVRAGQTSLNFSS
jgi:hypothetical protein